MTAFFRVLAAAGRLGGHGHAVRRRVFTAGRFPVSVRPRRARWRPAGHACPVREFFTRLAGVLSVDPVPLDPAGGACRRSLSCHGVSA